MISASITKKYVWKTVFNYLEAAEQLYCILLQKLSDFDKVFYDLFKNDYETNFISDISHKSISQKEQQSIILCKFKDQYKDVPGIPLVSKKKEYMDIEIDGLLLFFNIKLLHEQILIQYITYWATIIILFEYVLVERMLTISVFIILNKFWMQQDFSLFFFLYWWEDFILFAKIN